MYALMADDAHTERTSDAPDDGSDGKPDLVLVEANHADEPRRPAGSAPQAAAADASPRGGRDPALPRGRGGAAPQARARRPRRASPRVPSDGHAAMRSTTFPDF